MSRPTDKAPDAPMPATRHQAYQFAVALAEPISRQVDRADEHSWWSQFLRSIGGMAMEDLGTAATAQLLHDVARDITETARKIEIARRMAKPAEGNA